MSAARQGVAGATRDCPHCKATILDSASVCPACRGHLRFSEAAAKDPVDVPLRVEGTIQQPRDGGSSEYSVVLAIRNERGEIVTRQVVGVGALRPNERRSFSLSVELFEVPGGKR
ncbi:MAG: hypothetical protein H0W24_09510 [Lysobacter sp.]|nr:hypothetical protein [Lysobacter sp.]MDQ3270345.1 hypothetical protein [Pseudomonadota bacterium]